MPNKFYRLELCEERERLAFIANADDSKDNRHYPAIIGLHETNENLHSMTKPMGYAPLAKTLIIARLNNDILTFWSPNTPDEIIKEYRELSYAIPAAQETPKKRVPAQLIRTLKIPNLE